MNLQVGFHHFDKLLQENIKPTNMNPLGRTAVLVGMRSSTNTSALHAANQKLAVISRQDHRDDKIGDYKPDLGYSGVYFFTFWVPGSYYVISDPQKYILFPKGY